jgi:transcriptional regulator with XRE-family HTH domain
VNSTLAKIGEQIAAARLAKGWTQDGLALEARVATSRVRELERGDGIASVVSLVAVTRALGMKLTVG